MSTPTHVLMRHPELQLTAEMATGAVDVWRAHGWLLADEPDPAPAQAENTDTDVPPLADDTTNRPAARKRANDSQEN